MEMLKLSSTQLNTIEYLDGQAITPVLIGMNNRGPIEDFTIAKTLVTNTDNLIVTKRLDVEPITFGDCEILNPLDGDRVASSALQLVDGAQTVDVATGEVLTKTGKTVFVEVGNSKVPFYDVLLQGGAILEGDIIQMDRPAATAQRYCIYCG